MTRLGTVEDVRAFVRDCPPATRLLARGGGTKPALSLPSTLHPPPSTLHLSALSGVLEYEPSEFTFTALAGAPVAEVAALLEQHGQYLPFDPPLAARGATLGGTVAAGLSGPGRYRYGGARDFLLGVRYVDGAGGLVRGGGKVVKNAAGFDIPKLMIGSLGAYGILVELSFKVFPWPEAYATLRLDCPSTGEAVQSLYCLTASQFDLDALDLEPQDGSVVVWARLAGLPGALPARLDRLRGLLGGGEVVQGDDEMTLWRQARDFEWAPPDWALIKVPVTPGRVAALEEAFTALPTRRRYSAGAQVLWLATAEPVEGIDALLTSHGLSGLVLAGPPGPVRLGVRAGESFARRVKQALDPGGRFVER